MGAATPVTATPTPIETSPFPGLDFVAGANLPWMTYGCDYGANAWFPDGGLGARAGALGRFEAALARLAEDGVSAVRLFVFCDARSGIRSDLDGSPVGLDEAVFRDLDAALDTASACAVRLVPVLFDFHLCGPRRVVHGAAAGGRGAWVADARATDRLVRHVVRPLAERYGTHPAIAAWDLCNEPEWFTRPFAAPSAAGTVVPFERGRAFLGELASAVRADARQPITVGSAGSRSLELVRSLGLDFYQVHWYESKGWSALARPVRRLGLDAPLVLGEYPGRTERTTTEAIVTAARDAGYVGAFVWSALSRDPVSGYTGGRPLDL